MTSTPPAPAARRATRLSGLAGAAAAFLLGGGALLAAPPAEAPSAARPAKPGQSPRLAVELPPNPPKEPAASTDDDAAPDDDADIAHPAQVRVVLVNGGSAAAKNYLSHFHHLQDMVAALRARGIPADRIDVFSADGDDPGKDLATRDTEPPGFALVDGTPAGLALRPPELTNTVWEGVTLRPARLRELRKWFAETGHAMRPGDTLFLFVTDHGSKNVDDPGNGLISLWGETLSVLEYRALLGYLRPGVKVVNVMSQCYSGAFADAMAPLSGGPPGGDVCGFYSTTGDREAYGCYPEGRDRDRLGHAFRFIDMMGRHASLDDIHAAVLVTDTTPDVPVRTSDLYLENLLRRESERRKVPLDEVADESLAAAWKNRARWEREIRLLDRIGEVYGTFSPRTLAELQERIDSLDALSKEIDTYEDRWKVTIDDLRKENLEQFRTSRPEWKDRLDLAKIQALTPAARRTTLTELIPALQEYTAGKPEVWSRYQDLLATDDDARRARYRVDTRLAALLRMRTLLIRVAGEEFLGGPVDAGAPVRAGSKPPAGAVSNPVAGAASKPPADSGSKAAAGPGSRTVPGAGSTAASAADGPDDSAPALPPRLAAARDALASLRDCEAQVIGSLDHPEELPPARETVEALPPFEEDLAAVRRALPSWLGIRFQPAPDKQLDALGVSRGAAMVDQVYQDGPAMAAGITPGDILLGPPGAHFSEPTQVREWTMTSERGKPLVLDVRRGDAVVQTTVTLAPYPAKIPDLPAPPKEGDEAPGLGSLKMVRETGKSQDAWKGQRRMVFFWATWCAPCKSSVPELLAWSRSSGVPVVAVSDEDEDTIRKFLGTWTAPFPDLVASDVLRRTQVTYAVSGTPTFVLVDGKGKIEWRKVGYSPKDHLGVPGWKWDGE